MTVAGLLEASAGSHPAQDAVARGEREWLLAACLGRDRSWLRAFPEREVDEGVAGRYRELLARRAGGEPLAYVLGRRGFWTLELELDRGVLIPRPETELLVEWALELDLPARARVADLGTGSGAVALALASERGGWRVLAADLSEAALAVAQRNAARHALPLEFRLSNWFDGLAGEQFELIVSNPPYIAEADPHLAQGDLRFEPRLALVAGGDGLRALRELVRAAPVHLRGAGWLLVEHGWDQGAAVRELFAGAGFRAVETRRDLAGHERATGGRLC